MAIIKFNTEQTLSEISLNFQTVFPFLQLQFFSETHLENQGSSLKNKLELDFVLKGTSFEINENSTVAELESAFQQNFNISCQVLRKSGNIWLQTTTTDHWTLAKQNEEGKPFTEESEVSDYSLEDNN